MGVGVDGNDEPGLGLGLGLGATRVGPPIGVVLAAGRGTRFGGPKQVADLGGRPLVTHAVATVVDADLDVLVVVGAGPEGDRIAQAARSGCRSSVRIATNPHPGRGMGSSLAAAATAIGPRPMVVLLADQPGVPAAEVVRVARALEAGAEAVMTSYEDGGRGHPVGFGAALHDRLLALRGEGAGRDLLLATGPVLVEVDHPRPQDVDTPADLAAMRRPES